MIDNLWILENYTFETIAIVILPVHALLLEC